MLASSAQETSSAMVSYTWRPAGLADQAGFASLLKRRFLSNVVYEEVLTRLTYVHLKHLQLHFLKECAVMCEVIQLLYSNECTRDQYPFNGQMRTSTSLVPIISQTTVDYFMFIFSCLICYMNLISCFNV